MIAKKAEEQAGAGRDISRFNPVLSMVMPFGNVAKQRFTFQNSRIDLL